MGTWCRALLLAASLASHVPSIEAQSGVSLATLRREPAGARMLRVPIATDLPSGAVDALFDNAWDRNHFPLIGRQQNFFVALGLIPRITISARGTKADERGTGNALAEDLSANVQLLLLRESARRPALAVGINDVNGAVPHFRTRYAVASKTLFKRARATVGYGLGPDALEGLFGGAELAVAHFLDLFGEYDTHGANAGARVYPMPRALEARGIPRASIDLLWQDGGHLALGIALRTMVGGSGRPASIATPSNRYRRSPMADADSDALRRALVDDGFEDVRLTRTGPARDTLLVEYQNRRYNRNELDALGVVLGMASLRAPAGVTHVRAIVSEVGLPVLGVTTSVDSLLAFANDNLSSETFAAQLAIEQTVRRPGRDVTVTPLANRSRFRLDLFLRPRLETVIFSDLGSAEGRFSVMPNAVIHVGPGTSINTRARVPIGRTFNYPERLGDPVVDRVLVQQAMRLPFLQSSSSVAAVTQVSVGRFDEERVGIADEAAVTFWSGKGFAKGTVARLGRSIGELDQWVALGNGRVRYPPWGMTLSVTAGSFIDRDRGIAADLSRFFGNVELGVFIRHTDRGSLAGGRFAVPLTPGRESRPSRVRLRFPDVYAYEQRSEVLTDVQALLIDLGRGLATEHELERIYWNRDRSYASYIRRHVDIMKQGMRRWIDDAF